MGLSAAALVAGVIRDVPVDPDAPEARDWVLRELAKAEYQAAKPTLFDLVSQALLDWLRSLTLPAGPGLPPLGLIVILVIVLVVVGVAFAVYGVPRLNRRSSVGGALFGEDDDRDAAEIRRAAEAAARAGEWSIAIAEQFRALARSLSDRTVISISPGTTAHDVARRAADVFPSAGDRLGDAAGSFDSVRYLGGSGSREEWEKLAALDREIEVTRPRIDEPAAPAGAPR